MRKSLIVVAVFAAVAFGKAPAKAKAQLKGAADDASPDADPVPSNPYGPTYGQYRNPYTVPWVGQEPGQPGPYSGIPAPYWSPNSRLNPYNPVNNPYTTAAYPGTNPMHPQWGHPGFNPYHPLNNPWHPANAFPAFPSYLAQPNGAFNPQNMMMMMNQQAQAQQQQQQSAFLSTSSKAKGKVSASAKAAAKGPFDEAQNNWNNYFAGPTSEFTWPGAPDAAPGVHPNLGGRLNPFNPLGAPSHPYPFPMHQGVKNGDRHPRPFTSTGAYYPGQSDIPPNFFGPAPVMPYGFGVPGFQAPYFPAAKNGAMQ